MDETVENVEVVENEKEKIQMITPLVEMDGDEMTRILWKWVKEILIDMVDEDSKEYLIEATKPL